MSQQLSDDLARQIENEALASTARLKNNNDGQAAYIQGRQDGYHQGATTYAVLLKDAERRNKECSDLLCPLLEYGQSKEANIPLGASITATILERAKLCERLAEALEYIEKTCKEAGLDKVAIDNPVHMAIYHSIHAANQTLSNYNQLIKKP